MQNPTDRCVGILRSYGIACSILYGRVMVGNTVVTMQNVWLIVSSR